MKVNKSRRIHQNLIKTRSFQNWFMVYQWYNNQFLNYAQQSMPFLQKNIEEFHQKI